MRTPNTDSREFMAFAPLEAPVSASKPHSAGVGMNRLQRRNWVPDMRGLKARMMSEEEGGSLVEMAICLPILLLIVTGITTFGLTFNNYLMLTDGVSIGARALAISRSATTDPCAVTAQAVEAAAPYLTPSKLTFSFDLNGTAYTGTSCSSGSTSTGAAGNLVQGKSATVKVTYPCNLSVYGANLSPGCTLTSQTTELVQ